MWVTTLLSKQQRPLNIFDAAFGEKLGFHLEKSDNPSNYVFVPFFSAFIDTPEQHGLSPFHSCPTDAHRTREDVGLRGGWVWLASLSSRFCSNLHVSLQGLFLFSSALLKCRCSETNCRNQITWGGRNTANGIRGEQEEEVEKTPLLSADQSSYWTFFGTNNLNTACESFN